jgi:hypothetical protein
MNRFVLRQVQKLSSQTEVSCPLNKKEIQFRSRKMIIRPKNSTTIHNNFFLLCVVTSVREVLYHQQISPDFT